MKNAKNLSLFSPVEDTSSFISSTTRSHSDDSTHLIPSPGSPGKPFKRYEPFFTKPVVIISVPVLMVALGLALEIAIFISNKHDGFEVSQKNIFILSPHFQASFFPTLVVLPFAIAWRLLDEYVRRYQPYIVLKEGNAKAEESLLLDYTTLGQPLTLFRALNFNHQVVFWSSLTAILTQIYVPLAGSTFNIQQRSRSSDVLIPGTKTIGLSTDILDLKAFAAAAGYVDSSGFLDISDPPFVCQKEWATPTYEFPPLNQYLNGTMIVETSGIFTNATCSNPSEPPILTPVGTTNLNLSSKSRDGCVNSLLFDFTVATNQYGVSDVACPGNTSTLPSYLRPVMFWFFHIRNDNTPEARTVFCAPTIQAFNILATGDLNDGLMTSVNATGSFLPQNNVTGVGGLLNGGAYNGLIFDNFTNPFTQALAVTTRSLVPAAIFQSAELQPSGLQSTFDLPNGFLDLTTTLYTRYLSISALSIYFLAGPANTTLPATITSLVPILKIAPLPAHFLAISLILTGFIGIFLQVISWQKRKDLLLAAPPGSIASAVASTSRSGFGMRLLPHDDELEMKEKLDGLRFRLDKRTGAILADEIETPNLKSPQNWGLDDAKPSLFDDASSQTWSMMSSSGIARTTATELEQA